MKTALIIACMVTCSFAFANAQSEPHWVFVVTEWYNQGLVSQNDYNNLMNYLLTKNLLNPDTVNQIMFSETNATQISFSESNSTIFNPTVPISSSMADTPQSLTVQFRQGQITQQQWLAGLQECINNGQINLPQGIKTSTKPIEQIPSWALNNLLFGYDGSDSTPAQILNQTLIYLVFNGIFHYP